MMEMALIIFDAISFMDQLQVAIFGYSVVKFDCRNTKSYSAKSRRNDYETPLSWHTLSSSGHY